jgi:hypothetical protein
MSARSGSPPSFGFLHGRATHLDCFSHLSIALCDERFQASLKSVHGAKKRVQRKQLWLRQVARGHEAFLRFGGAKEHLLGAPR